MENMYDFKNKMKFFFLLCIFRILTEAVVVDFRYRRSLSAGRAVSLLGFACGVSPVPLFPQESSALPLQSTILESVFSQDLLKMAI
ncbi:hypothetical protein FZD05_21760 [Rossellomorea aquimaris]|nr:hypothetical protein FZD05_21760 [Rossellomorea aquimaris]